jgi:hypothetical protein
MNRDSKLLPLGIIGGLCAAVAAHPDLIEGVIELDKKAIASVVCLALAVIAGWLSTSPLPGKNDADTIGRR